MYSWVIDYVYIIAVALFALVMPYFSYKIEYKLFHKEYFLRRLVINSILFSLITIVLLWVKSFHINTIMDICFDIPVISYRNNAPQGCYDFHISKYQGVGWPITAMFWIVLQGIYSIIFYIIIYFFSSRHVWPKEKK